MSVFLYQGGLKLVEKSGVGRAVLHQKSLLRRAGINTVEHWHDSSEIIQINTVLPDSVVAAAIAKLCGKKIVYYGHSTMEDFKSSFIGSDQLAPLFKEWIKFCYSFGNVVLTPTEYSKGLLTSYGIQRPIYSVSNGIDTDFFKPSIKARLRFRRKYHLKRSDKAVISAGHYIERKGILEFIELAKKMPDVRFFWFGYTNPDLIPGNIKRAIETAPANLEFPGFIERSEMRDAYCGADAFVFLSHEETEGIVVLEALSCKVPALVRDIPVYNGWLVDGQNVFKAKCDEDAYRILCGMLDHSLPDLTDNGLKTAQSRSYSMIAKKIRGIYQKENLIKAEKRQIRTSGAYGK